MQIKAIWNIETWILKLFCFSARTLLHTCFGEFQICFIRWTEKNCGIIEMRILPLNSGWWR